MKTMISVLPACLALAGCMSAARHYRQLGSTHDRALTVGVVQKQVKVGLAQADVAVALGAPNIVTRDSHNRETWIYDKIATEASFSQGEGNVNAMVTGSGTFPGGGNIGNVTGQVGGSYAEQAGAASLTQRTLTVVIKFDSSSAVESFSYQSTTF